MITLIASPCITAVIGLCLGSFLHAMAHRIAFDRPLTRQRSHCPHCDRLIAWYHNIPVISWVWLRGRCSSCAHPISWSYPATELITAILMVLVWHYLPLSSTIMGLAYSLFAAALVVATVTDFYSLTIPQLASIWLAPVGVAAAASGYLHISLWQSVIGAALGYASLWIINFIFKKMRNIDGIGVGDMELLSMIGAFIGPTGLYYTVLIASITGSAWGLTVRLIHKQEPMTPIPFGPFLALGGILFLLLESQILSLFALNL